jgi:hypothetical protein
MPVFLLRGAWDIEVLLSAPMLRDRCVDDNVRETGHGHNMLR